MTFHQVCEDFLLKLPHHQFEKLHAEPDSRERAQPDVEDLPDGLGNVRPKAKDEEETEETDDV